MTAPQAKTGVEVERLPELPMPSIHAFGDIPERFLRENHYSAEQMRAYATAALAAERAEIERLMGDLRASEEDRLELHKALKTLVDRDFTFFSGQMIGASKPITRDEVLAARAALSPSQGGPNEVL